MHSIPTTDKAATTMSILEVTNLGVQFSTHDGAVYAVNGLSFALDKGQTLGIVGESGSGKSQSVLAMMGLLARNGKASGQALYKGSNLLDMPADALNKIRGNRMAMIFQDPMTSLNPYLTVERQMTEVLQFHKGMDRAGARAVSVRMLDAVKIPEAARRVAMYPHEFSGGMRQRVMIAMALLCEPEVLIADEPTTALDVTIQGQILDLISELVEERGMALILISHDLGVIAENVSRMLVMYGGTVVESGPTQAVFGQMAHPYTRGLFGARPQLGGARGKRLSTIEGTVPELADLPLGCPFQERCALASAECAAALPQPIELGHSHRVSCLHLELPSGVSQP